MRYTVFDTPVIRWIFGRLSQWGMKLSGWRIDGEFPRDPKFVMIAAPHTSNWDFPLMMAAVFIYRKKLYWMGKHTLFRWPFGALMRWLGGIPIHRGGAHDVVAQSIEQFTQNERLVLAVPPEGTRKKVRTWKTGFYYIALGAGVPIALGFLDYRRKAAGFGPTLIPTGDIEADMKIIRRFYADIAGKYPDQFGDATLSVKS